MCFHKASTANVVIDIDGGANRIMSREGYETVVPDFAVDGWWAHDVESDGWIRTETTELGKYHNGFFRSFTHVVSKI